MTVKTKNKDVTPSFEARVKRLQAIVDELERGERPLEEAVALYKEGLELSKTCQSQLDKARHDVQILDNDGSFSPFEPL